MRSRATKIGNSSLPVYSSPPSCTNMTEPIRNETICPLINVQTFGNFPLLSTAAKFYHQFEMRQQNLAVSYRSPGDLNIQQSIFIDNTTYLRIENGNLHLLSITLGKILQDYCTQSWMKAVKPSIIQVSLLHKLGLSARQFPRRNDSRLACFVGAHVDSNDLISHLGTNYESRKNFVGPFWQSWSECAQQFKEVGPSAEENLLITLGILLEEAERQNCLSENGCYLKDKLYSEFYGFLSELHGPMKASTRLIKLLALQVDAKHLTNAQLQMIELIRVFRPDLSEYIWHDRILSDDSNSLVEYQKIAHEITC